MERPARKRESVNSHGGGEHGDGIGIGDGIGNRIGIGIRIGIRNRSEPAMDRRRAVAPGG